jgi:hypothetical protein
MFAKKQKTTPTQPAGPLTVEQQVDKAITDGTRVSVTMTDGTVHEGLILCMWEGKPQMMVDFFLDPDAIERVESAL